MESPNDAGGSFKRPPLPPRREESPAVSRRMSVISDDETPGTPTRQESGFAAHLASLLSSTGSLQSSSGELPTASASHESPVKAEATTSPRRSKNNSSGKVARSKKAALASGPPVPPRDADEIAALRKEVERLRPLARLLMPGETMELREILATASTRNEEDDGDSAARMDELDEIDVDYKRDATIVDGVLSAGTLDALIAWLTDHAAHDPNYLSAFFITFRSFTTPRELFRKLMSRHEAMIPRSVAHDLALAADWTKNKQTVIRLRVVQAMRHWVEKHQYDLDDDELYRRMVQFAEEKMDPKYGAMLGKVIEKARHKRESELARTQIKDAQKRLQEHLETLEKRLGECEDISDVLKIEGAPKDYPPLQLPPNYREPSAFLLDWPEVEVARQLALQEFEYFARVQPHEFLNQNWTRKNKEQLSPNLLRFIGRFNTVGALVTSTLVQVERLDDRAKLLKKWVHIAQSSLEISNFSVMMSLVSALEGPAVSRLGATWAALPAKSKEVYESLKAIALPEKNFRALRDRTSLSAPPKVPYIGTALSDLTFIEDGNPDMTECGFVNFYKRQLLSQQIMQIAMWQQDVYVFQSLPTLQNYFNSFPLLSAEQSYECSLALESRRGTTSGSLSNSSSGSGSKVIRKGGK